MGKRKKGSGFKLFLLSLFLIFVISAASFVLWLFWTDLPTLERFTGKGTSRTQPQRKSPEKISEEERKKLNQILKQRQAEKPAPSR